MQDAIDIIPFPTVHRENGLKTLESTIINDAIISSDDKFIVAATNNNLILIFKLTNQVWGHINWSNYFLLFLHRTVPLLSHDCLETHLFAIFRYVRIQECIRVSIEKLTISLLKDTSSWDEPKRLCLLCNEIDETDSRRRASSSRRTR